MRVEKTMCDTVGCKADNATTFSMFHDRRLDGTGNMENWYHKFDLCPQHAKVLLVDCLDLLDRDAATISRGTIITLLEENNIMWRSE